MKTLKVTSKMSLLQNTPIFLTFLEVLHKHAPIKILRFKGNPFMTKSLRKAVMHMSKFQNILCKTRANEDWDNYKK